MLYNLVNIDILNEIKLSFLSIASDSYVQKSCQLFLIMKFIFCKEMSLESLKFLKIMLMKNENNIINVEEDDDLIISKTARFIKNECKI